MTRTVLFVEKHSGDAVGIALESERASRQMWQQHRGDADVVVDDLSLGEAALGVEDLVEVTERETTALDFDDGFAARHSERLDARDERNRDTKSLEREWQEWYNGRMRSIELAERIGAVCEGGDVEVSWVASFAGARAAEPCLRGARTLSGSGAGLRGRGGDRPGGGRSAEAMRGCAGQGAAAGEESAPGVCAGGRGVAALRGLRRRRGPLGHRRSLGGGACDGLRGRACRWWARERRSVRAAISGRDA